MNGYRPLDLSGLCNGGVEVLGDSPAPPVGRQRLRGLPFLIGAHDGGGKCFVVLDGASSTVRVPVGEPARSIVFAHRLVESEILDGGPVGVHVADYVFHIAGAGAVRAPVQERFDIGVVGSSWYGRITHPYRAVTDRDDYLLPRHEGRWADAGRRQTEAQRGLPLGYYLWAWANPHPDQAVEAIEITPRGPRFIIAGITVGEVDEHPFARQAGREVRLLLTDPDQAAESFDLEVDVDRGAASYAYPLPAASVDEFLNDPAKGFGEPLNTQASPAYVKVAAIPSATVTVRHGGQHVGNASWRDVETEGVVDTGRVRVELADRGRNWVHVTVLDDDTDQPVPCRVHFRSPEGIPYQPHGHHQHVNSNTDTFHFDIGGDVRLGQVSYAYIDGACQGWLPRGQVLVDVARGFEYQPLRTAVTIAPAQRELTLRLKRWVDMNARGWYSGDSHVHFLSTSGAHLEAAGEDLNVVNLLQTQIGSLYTNIEDFTGRASISEQHGTIVYTAQENRQHFLGHLTLWGLKEPVMPWCSDGPSEAELGSHMETTLSHWADQAHAQGGHVIIPHLPNPNGEVATLIATGRADAVEMIRHQPFNHLEYYRYLNNGYRLPLVGGTDKMGSDVPAGLYRTYAHIPHDQDFSYQTWSQAVVAGRTFLSAGPIIDLSVDGHAIGDTIGLSGPGTVEVHARAESIFPIHALQIVHNGSVVASTNDGHSTRRLELREKIKIDRHSWLAARCGALDYDDPTTHHDGWNRGIFAHTSPIYVACGGDWHMHNPETTQYMQTLIHGAMTYINETAATPSSPTTHHHGEPDHLAYLQHPFREAQDALQARQGRP